MRFLKWKHLKLDVLEILQKCTADYQIRNHLTFWARYVNSLNEVIKHYSAVCKDRMVAILQMTISNYFLYENCCNLIWISPKIYFTKHTIDIKSGFVQVMVWHRIGDTPLSVTMMAKLLTHICVICWPPVNVPRRVNSLRTGGAYMRQ